jgi:hypothetical protein
VPRRRTLRERIGERIARRRDDVFLTREFRDLGGEDQVLRALRGLVRGGQLVRLGYGVYGRAETSQLSGRPMLAARGGFIDAARQALDKATPNNYRFMAGPWARWCSSTRDGTRLP